MLYVRAACSPWMLWAVVAVCAAATAQAAPTAGPGINGVRVGFGGHYKVGTWTPVEVSLRGVENLVAGKLRLVVPDGDGVPTAVSAPVERGQSSVACLVRFGRVAGRLDVELDDGDQRLARRTFRAGEGTGAGFLPAVSALRRLIVCLGAEPLGVEEAVELSGVDPGERPAVVRLEDCRELPSRWWAYEGVDLVVISTSRPELVADERIDAARLAAIDEWVRQGGKLVLCAGSQSVAALAEGQPLSRFVPGRIEGVARVRQAAAWETYAKATDAMPRGGRSPSRAGMPVPQLVDVQGMVEVQEAGRPLVVRSARGLGQVVFAAADLDQPPFAEWTGRPALVWKLLDLPMTAAGEAKQGSAVTHFGFRNIAGQLRSALDLFADVGLLPFSLVAGMMVVYVLLIGLGDYFFLRKVVGRMRWTWLTFPVVVLVVCVVAYFLAGGLKGDRVRVNQVDLLDVDTTSGRVRATSWMNLFSPRVDRYNLAIRPQLPGGGEPEKAQRLLAWLGLPGEALGGMDPQTTAFGETAVSYEFAPQLDALQGMPVEQWSTRSLTARWTATADLPIESDLVAEDRVPAGSIVHRFDFPLTDCLLAYRQWVFELGTLEPGKPCRIHSLLKRSELKTLLTGRRIIREGKDYRQESTPYDLNSRDLAYVLRTMVFFQAAGGQRYTGLTNNYQGFVDGSDLLKTGRAILVARLPDAPEVHPPTLLLRDGEPMTESVEKHLAVCRFVLPVSQPAGE